MGNSPLRPIAASLTAAVLSAVATGAGANSVAIAGWNEIARVSPGGLEFPAKLDTGARTSSIHAPDAKIYYRGDKPYVRFTLKSKKSGEKRYDMPVFRISRTRDMTGPVIERPVVILEICIGNVAAETEVNLSHRKGFNFALLIGRSFLTDRFSVDSSRQYQHPLRCPRKAEKL